MKKIAFFFYMFTLSLMLNAQRPSIGGFNVYYGHLHNHSNVSDGKGTPLTAYSYAKNTGKLDFFGLSDHCYSITSSEWTDIKNQADAYNVDGLYTTFWGFEWTSNSNWGHVTVINTDDYCTVTNYLYNEFTELLTWLSTRNGLAFFNHPGRENDLEKEFSHFTTTPSDKFVGMELWNNNSSFSVYYYNDGYYTGDNNKSYYDEANSRGWRIGATGASDNHTGTWGADNNYRMAILANNLTRSDLLEAMQARRFYSTLDKNLALSFKINEKEMGSVLEAGTYIAQIQATDGNGEYFKEVKMFDKNHNVVNTWVLNTPTINVTHTLNTLTGDYFYVKVKQADGNEAISSPIWITGGTTNQEPACSITKPVNNTNFTAPANITITADASDTDGTITKVEYYLGNTKLGEVLNSPFNFEWANVPSGTYTISVKATDNSGAVTTSVAVTINVDASGTVNTSTLGNTEVYNLVNAVASRRALPVTFGEHGDIQSISIYHNGGTGNMLLGVYADNSGSPGSLLGVTPAIAVTGTEGWQTVSLSGSVSVGTGQTVWLAWVFQNSVGVRFTSATPGRAQSGETWTAGMPASFGASTIGTTKFSIYCNYTTEVGPPVVTKDLGNTEVYNLVNAVASRRALPVTFSEDGDIQSISIYHNGGTGNMLLGVYADNSGSPGSLLGVTPATAVTGTEGWQTVTLSSSVSVSTGQTVWLAWVFQNSVSVRFTTGTPSRAQSVETWTTGMPASFGASTIGTTKFSIYCTYTTEGTKSAKIATAVSPYVELDHLKVYPNPFNDKLRFEFISPESVNARIDLYDMTGRMVKTIFEQPIEGGVNYEAEFRPETIISGMYFYRLVLGENIYNGKVIYKKE